MSFTNKVVIVTGASSGIGAATAKLFAKEGANVVMVGRNEEKLAAVSAEVTKIGKKPLVIKADVSYDDEVKKIIDETISVFKQIDVLVNNAGLGADCSILSGKIVETYDRLMSTNVRAVINLTSLAAPHLIKTKGNIVNISSICGKTIVSADSIPYSVSKAALDHFSRGAAFELAALGVRVNIVSPGPVATDFSVNSKTKVDIRNVGSILPLKQVAQPEEIAELILFCASQKAKGITGSDFVSDEGYLLNKQMLDK